MNRLKKHKMKKEKPESSTSVNKEQEHDLAYYIHDRVELMHQVFSVLKSKELKAMAPECVRNIDADDLQELCTEELLGISSKRLCAILDGGEPPSDTESSSPSPSPELETISLDSISSDEDILSETSSKKKKHKHRRRSKSKKKRMEEESGTSGTGRARGGLTVLELLELQARARAIRAQLHNEQTNKQAPEAAVEGPSSDNEVEIKEEAPEVVEISSDDEKPSLQLLMQAVPPPTVQEATTDTQTPTVTKRINDLIITVPQTKQTRKIKLNRNKVVITVPVEPDSVATNDNVPERTVQVKDKAKKKKNVKKRKEGSDHDEITLQLSDSEKMDLLEDFERKHYDSVSSSEDSDSSDSEKSKKNKEKIGRDVRIETETNPSVTNDDKIPETVDASVHETEGIDLEKDKDCIETNNVDENPIEKTVEVNTTEDTNAKEIPEKSVIDDSSEINIEKTSDAIDICSINEIPLMQESNDKQTDLPDNTVVNKQTDIKSVEIPEVMTEKSDPERSEGEVSDEGSEIEALDVQPEVICISDDEKKRKEEKRKKSKKRKEDIQELSDDSSCYEVAGTILSKEPTAEEIEALSAKIDEIEREEVITQEEIREYESLQADNVSWKDRYLDSKKVKRVLSTSNILNALRKKNKELKKSIEKIKVTVPNPEPETNVEPTEGTIEHYNMLQGSTKYVDPVVETDKDINTEVVEKVRESEGVTNEMRKDAKQLLKMYKKLLKYNDMNRQKDPNKKKKKKAKKSKSKDKSDGSSVAATEKI